MPIIKKSNENEKLEEVAVVCVSGGCNTTQINSDSNKDGITADVVVHVKTKVDPGSTKNESKEVVADVPVVVGYGGTNGVASTNINQRPPTNPNSILHTTVDTNPVLVPTKDSYPRTNYPGSGRRIGQTNVFNPYNVPFRTNTRPPVYVQPNYNGRNYKNVRYDSNNAIEVQIPYFEPSFNKHYFREYTPPQFVWHPKVNQGYNPVAFKPINKANWDPLGWNLRRPNYMYETVSTTCSCPVHRNPDNWQIRSLHARNVENVKSNAHIDDKIAPLNN